MSESNAAAATANAEILTLTEKQARERINTEPGFNRLYLEKLEKGEVKIISEEEAAIAGVEKPAEAAKPDAEPAKAGEKKPDQAPDEEITVKIKKSQLGKYKSIGERLKAADELDNYTKFNKIRIKELEEEIASGEPTKAELVKIRAEKAELEKKLSETQSQKEKVVSEGIIPDIKVPDFALDLKDDQELFDVDTQKKVIGHVKDITEVNKKLAQANKTLTDRVEAMSKKFEATEKDVEETKNAQKRKIEDDTRQIETENVYARASALQGQHEELKTVAPIKEIDKQYVDFLEDLYRLAKANTPKDRTAAIDRYFGDSTEEGDNFRKSCEDSGIKPPEEVDKYLIIRNIVTISKNTQEIGDDGKPRPLDYEKAYSLHLTNTGALKQRAQDEIARDNARAAAARKQNAGKAEVAGPEASAVATQEEIEFIKSAEQIINGKGYRAVKNSPNERKIVDAYHARMNMNPVDWDKL